MLMKLGQFISFYRRKKLIRKFYKKLRSDNQFQALLSFQRIKYNLYSNMKFLSYLYYICSSNCQELFKSACIPPQIFFKKDSLNFKRVWNQFPRQKLSYVDWPNFIARLFLLPKLFNKMCSMFYAQTFDDVMIYEFLKS